MWCLSKPLSPKAGKDLDLQVFILHFLSGDMELQCLQMQFPKGIPRQRRAEKESSI